MGGVVSPNGAPVDPVRVARAKWAKWGQLGSKVGYGLLAIAVVVFVAGFVTEFNGLVAGVVVACLLGSCVTLAPGIVIGYAVRKAEREDPIPRL